MKNADGHLPEVVQTTIARWRSLLFLFLLFAGIGKCGAGHVYSYTNLTSFPHGLPDDVTEIDIRDSTIPVVDYIEPYPALYNLKLVNVELTTFPNITNISDVVVSVTLSKNKLQQIESTPPSASLRFLDLSQNQLTSFPTLPDISANLDTLQLWGNQMVNIGTIAFMPSLKRLSLDNNQLIEFPVLSNLSSSLEQLTAVGNQFHRVNSLELFPRLKILKLGRRALEEFPDLTGVSSSLEELHIKYGSIESVDYVPKMTRLTKLILFNNRIKDFPNLTNVSSTLVELDLSYNRIKYVGSLPEMIALEILNLRENHISSFPDLRTMSALRSLDLFHNNITEMAKGWTTIARSLTYLDLRQNPASSLPFLCSVNQSVGLFIGGLSLNCDWRMAFLKTMEAASRITYLDSGPQCSQPSYLAAKDWNDISIMELLNETGIEEITVKETSFRQIQTTTWSCLFDVKDVIYSVSALQCAAICGRRRDCLMYATVEDRCLLTNHDAGSFDIYNTHSNWHIKF